MTTTNTRDTEATVRQCMDIFDAGADLVRITAPAPKDAENLANIKKLLLERGYKQPLVADIHFSPKSAQIALEFVEKVRINPGNYTDEKRFKTRDYTDKEYQEELEQVKEKFIPLLKRASELGRVLRIGTNHGSLSDRIMNRYGDNPLGMVESAMEFLRIARENDFHDIVVSMKSSNPQVMIQAYRLLVATFKKENFNLPLHIGVTEAGSGRDGRMKSALGIGSLLADGIGDTIRVSLTENSVKEITAAKEILKCFQNSFRSENPLESEENQKLDIDLPKIFQNYIKPYEYERKKSFAVEFPYVNYSIGEKNAHAIALPFSLSQKNILKDKKDFLWVTQSLYKKEESFFHTLRDKSKKPWLLDLGTFSSSSFEYVSDKHILALSVDLSISEVIENKNLLQSFTHFYDECTKKNNKKLFIHLIVNPKLKTKQLSYISKELPFSFEDCVISLSQKSYEDANEYIYLHRLYLSYFLKNKKKIPTLLLRRHYKNLEEAQQKASIEIASLLLDGLGDAIYVEIENENCVEILNFQLDLLQTCRLRLSKTEYISCPSCGRTLFDLEKTTARIQKKTSHLKGLKIAVMGCIVNGPGEMADADFGYVGAGPGKVHLYQEKKLMKANIPSQVADEELVKLIQESGAWQNP